MSARLARWLQRPGRPALLARVCGVSLRVVDSWARGARRPREELRPAVFILTGVHPRIWRTKDERARRRASVRRAMVAAKKGEGT